MKKQTIKDQQQFIEWLKKNGLYNPLESGETMQKMHDVWAAMLGERA